MRNTQGLEVKPAHSCKNTVPCAGKDIAAMMSSTVGNSHSTPGMLSQPTCTVSEESSRGGSSASSKDLSSAEDKADGPMISVGDLLHMCAQHPKEGFLPLRVVANHIVNKVEFCSSPVLVCG